MHSQQPRRMCERRWRELRSADKPTSIADWLLLAAGKEASAEKHIIDINSSLKLSPSRQLLKHKLPSPMTMRTTTQKRKEWFWSVMIHGLL